MKVFCLVLNWNKPRDTISCLKSLSEASIPSGWELETVVIDNGSTDDSVAQVKKAFPEIKIIEAGENLGFSGGANFGFKYTFDWDADFALLLNNDITVERDFFSPLLEFCEREKGWAAASPLVKDQEGAVCDSGWQWQSFWARAKPLDRPKSITMPYEADIISGCAVLFNASALRKVGLLDERFFLRFEDVDWWLRARRAGFSLWVVPRSVVCHKISQSFGGTTSPMSTYYFVRNNLLLVRKYYRGFLRVPPYAFLLALSLKVMFNLFSREIPDKVLCIKAIFRAWQDYALGRFGEGWLTD